MQKFKRWIKNDSVKVGEFIYHQNQRSKHWSGNVTFKNGAVKARLADGAPYIEFGEHMEYFGPADSYDDLAKLFTDKHGHNLDIDDNEEAWG